MTKENYFVSKVDNSFGRTVAMGGIYSIVAQVCLLLLQILSTSLLARFLKPDDFGLVALSVTFTGFIAIFKDLGLSMATVQKNILNHNQVSNLFWLNIGFCALLSLLIACLSPFVSLFYEDDRLLLITIVSGLSLIVAGFTVQHQALLRRNLHFKTLAIVNVVSALLGNSVCVVWAYFSHSYWALVLMPILSASIYAVAMWIFCSWRPSLFKRGVGTMSLLNYGKDMLHYGIVNYFARNADNFIVGKIGSPADLGYYSRSYSLMLVPVGQLISPLTGVVVSALSRLQDNAVQFCRYYLQIVKLISVLSFALVSLMFILSSEIIDIFLGGQWEAAKKIFSILCFAAFWQPLMSSSGWVYSALGNTKRFVKWGYINSISLIVVFLIGAIWGVEGVAYAYSIYMWLMVVPWFLFSFYRTPVSFGKFIKIIIKPLLFAVLFSVIGICVKFYLLSSLTLIPKTVGMVLLILVCWILYVVSDKIYC